MINEILIRLASRLSCRAGFFVSGNRTRLRALSCLAFGAALILSASPGGAEAPVGKIPYQGRLTDSSSQPLNGNYNLVFSLCDSAAGDCSAAPGRLWTETQNSVSVDRGLVSVNLGDATPIPSHLFSNATTYLEIAVNGESLSPRVRLLPAPYAFNAQTLQGYDAQSYVSTFTVQSVGGIKSFVSSVTIQSSAADALKVAGGITAGSGNVGIVDASGRIPAIGSLYFSSLDGSALTNVSGARFDAVATDTTTIQSAVAADTTTLRGRLDSVGVDTTSLRAVINVSTAGKLTTFSLSGASQTFTTPVTFLSSATLGATVQIGSATVFGTVSSTSGFVGVGSTLTALNASNLSLGTVPNERVDSSSVAKWNSAGQVDDYRLNPSSVTLFGPVRSRSILGRWSRLNLAANLTDSQLLLGPIDAANNAIAANSRLAMPFNGIIRGVIASGSGARTAGTATFEVFKNAVITNTTGIIDGTNTQYVASSDGADTFSAGDVLDLRVTTTSNWAPTTSEFFAWIVVEWTN